MNVSLQSNCDRADSSQATRSNHLIRIQTLQAVVGQLDALRLPEGHWIGQLSSSALSTATAISALSFYEEAASSDNESLKVLIDAGVAWMLGQQNEDGGFGDTPLSHSNISTSMLVIAALHACGQADEHSATISKTQSYVDAQGGVAGLRARYGKDKTFAVPILANCAMAGLVPWREVSALPFEAACVPQRFYNLMQLPVVSYAIPALVAIGQVKFKHDPPWDPVRKLIRSLSIEPSLRVLERMQPASGGYLEAVPLTSFVVMALVKSGRWDHPVVQEGVKFLRESFLETQNESPADPQSASPQGNWPIDTNLATWNTTLTINAIANHTPTFESHLAADPQSWRRCIDWLLSCQNKTKHPFTGAAPGGFGWSDLSGAVPDADDTPGALLALRNLIDSMDHWCDPADRESMKRQIHAAVELGLQWLVDLQNRDRGWPTFCRGWGKLPFDRSGSDITAHVIRALLAWQTEFDSPKIKKAIESGLGYLDRQQLPDGSWLPLWFGNQDSCEEINACYGTAKVLLAYRDANLFDTNQAKLGLKWLVENQSETGGWGGGKSLDWKTLQPHVDSERLSLLGNNSVEETSLCCELLLDAVADDANSDSIEPAAMAGVKWLEQAVELNVVSQHWPIGFYFAKLWYYEQMYPLVFSVGALAKAATVSGDRVSDDQRRQTK
jgi:squalene-hopene/tetraprenyl-beta-curcumene cyclase